MSNIAKMIEVLEIAQARAAEVNTDQKRINMMSNINRMVPGFGPSPIEYFSGSCDRTCTPEQFAQFVADKLAFARAHTNG